MSPTVFELADGTVRSRRLRPAPTTRYFLVPELQPDGSYAVRTFERREAGVYREVA